MTARSLMLVPHGVMLVRLAQGWRWTGVWWRDEYEHVWAHVSLMELVA